MDDAGVADAVEEFEREASSNQQLLPHVSEEDDDGPAAAVPDDPVGRLREELRRLAEELAEIDRRDAAQHGVLKGEIAHLVRRVARLEAVPRARHAR